MEDKLNSLFGQPFTETTIAQRHELYTRLHSLLAQEEAFWRQRSKDNWLQLGDQNTKYFHQRANRRRRRNELLGLFDEEGVWHDDKNGMERIIIDYFTKLFDSSGETNASAILAVVKPKVSAEMNQELVMPISNDEIKEALFQMHPSKAPGPDGMSPGFYQKHWEVVGNDVCDGVRYLLSSENMLQKINYTHVTLIPKKSDPTLMSELRPVSLCNVIYKICSKVLTNRLKIILPEVVSAFAKCLYTW